MRIFGCRKFSRLSSELVDRELTARESLFMDRHRAVCDGCAAVESKSDMALNMLRAAYLQEEVSDNFDDRVIRRFRVQSTRESLRYWSPAVIGAFAAGLALVAALQVITRASEMQHIKIPGGEARRLPVSKPIPLFDLDFSKSISR